MPDEAGGVIPLKSLAASREGPFSPGRGPAWRERARRRPAGFAPGARRPPSPVRLCGGHARLCRSIWEEHDLPVVFGWTPMELGVRRRSDPTWRVIEDNDAAAARNVSTPACRTMTHRGVACLCRARARSRRRSSIQRGERVRQIGRYPVLCTSVRADREPPPLPRRHVGAPLTDRPGVEICHES